MSRRPTVEWQVCGVCNYDCSYCIQSKKYRTGHPTEADLDGFLDFFSALTPSWEIKMTGGEPFAFRGFLARIVPGLIERTAHRISVLTNLSAPLDLLERFARLTRGRLEIVSASLHFEHVEVSEFVDKARRLRELMDPEARLVINTVLVPAELDRVARARAALEAVGLHLFPQVLKTKGGVFDYDADDRLKLRVLVGEAPTSRAANMAPSHLGKRCWAGADYFVLTQRGDAWSCRTSKRFSEGALGNVLDGSFQRRTAASECSYSICPCAVPANRGMIEGVSP